MLEAYFQGANRDVNQVQESTNEVKYELIICL